MDVSKLPRLSKTDAPAPQSGTPDPEVPSPGGDYRERTIVEPLSGRGPEAWISIGVGLILLFVFSNFTEWWTHVVLHTKAPSFLPITDVNTGAEIPYPKSVFFLNDLCIALFSYALIIEGVALLLARRPWLVMFAFAVTAAAVVLNLYYLAISYRDSGFSIISAVAVVFGGYIAWYQWRLIHDMRETRRHVRVQMPPHVPK